METTDNSFVTSQQKKKKRKRIRTIIGLCVVAIVLTVGIIILLNVLGGDGETTSVLNYRVSSISSGEISSTISGSGTLSALESTSVTAAAEATVTGVNYEPGETIAAGEIVMTLTSDEIESQIDELNDELASTRSSLATATQYLSNRKITATKAGIVKIVQASEGDIVDDMDYLCRIATDGNMRVEIPAVDGMQQYDAVIVLIDEDEQDGYVTELSDGVATIVFDDDYYSIGTSATVQDEDGNLLGSGEIDVNEYVDITADSGKIEAVKISENSKVSRGTTLFVLAEGAPSSTYTALKETESDLLDQIADLQDQLAIKAEYDCVLTSLSVEAGDTVTAGGSLCTLTGTDGYTLSLSIDELDIASVALGQDATITLDAIDGEYSGSVTNISYSGSGSYVTSYTATITTEPIAGAYPGMSASVEIITETSGETLIVSVNAIEYDGDTAYIMLAGDDASIGTTLAESELDLDALTTVNVTTGMSDGSYIAITGDGLSSGELIWVPDLTTSSTYSDDEETTTTFNFGSGSTMGGDFSGSDFGGGNMPSGGGNMGGGMAPGN